MSTKRQCRNPTCKTHKTSSLAKVEKNQQKAKVTKYGENQNGGNGGKGCKGKPYSFDEHYCYDRLLSPSQARAILDADSTGKVVLMAVPFWPQNGVSWAHVDPTIGDTSPQTRYSSYIQYQTQSRTYKSVQLDYRSDLANLTLPLRYYDLPSQSDFQQTLRNKNLTSDSIIILYDDTLTPGGAINATNYGVNRMAVRAMFVLQYYGHSNVFMINGGDQAWFKADFSGSSTNTSYLPYVGAPALSPHVVLGSIAQGAAPVSVPEPAPAPSNYVITGANGDYVISRDGVATERLNPCSVLLDARPYKMYVGTQQGGLIQCGALRKVARLGHVKGAVNAAWATYLEIVDGGAGVKFAQFKPTSALNYIMINTKSLVGSKKVVTICNEGIHAVMAWMVIYHLLNYDNVTVYEGSTAEWADGSYIFELGSPPGVLIAQDIEGYPMLSGLEDQ